MVEKKTLKEGEIICPKCNGTGGIDDGYSDEDSIKTCGKCFGDGKLDWIEAAMGKQSKMKSFFDDNLVQSMIDDMADKLAKKIDKEILETVILEANK
jgi:DnaJ-class molecular chaperone